jgi:myo-inositol-1(or 4)-monophosphatase
LNAYLGCALVTDELLDLAQRAARAAGELLQERFSRPAEGVSAKSTPTDLVSDADRASDALLVELISAERPDDGFITEESEGRKSGSGLSWVLDPLDATVNFLFGLPWWCVSVAVEDEIGAVAGAIYNPNVDEMFTAARGQGAFLNGRPMRVSDRAEIEKALVGTGFSYDAGAREEQARIAARVLPRARDLRRAGSAALDLAHLACGRLDGFYEAPLEHWDKAAGLLMISEAGGMITELPGPRGLTDGAIASNRELHEALVNLVLGEGDIA